MLFISLKHGSYWPKGLSGSLKTHVTCCRCETGPTNYELTVFSLLSDSWIFFFFLGVRIMIFYIKICIKVNFLKIVNSLVYVLTL